MPQVSPRSERRDIETEINQAIGRRIRALRLARGLSQEACSSRLGISFQQLQKYEKGRTASARVRSIAWQAFWKCLHHHFWTSSMTAPRCCAATASAGA
ncbi:helix-turn-helix domain-containing protein [Tistrella bauzanensis]